MENSTPGNSVATVVSAASARASTSAVGEVGAVVDAGRAELDRELDAGAVAELVAVDPQPEPRARPASSTARASSSVKACAECGSQKTSTQRACGAAAVEHRPGHQVEVCRSVAGVLGRHDVRAQEGRLGGELARDPQRPRLVLDGEAVATLDLDGRRALGAHLGDAGRHEPAQRGVVSRPGRGDGHPDPATVVGRAGHPRGELRAPVAGEDQVRVRVDEPRHHRAALDVDPVVGGGAPAAAPSHDDIPVLARRRRRRGAGRAGPRRCRHR